MHFLDNKEHIYTLLAQGATVLTPTNRLSEFLLRGYFANAKSKILSKPKCMPYNQALISNYEQLKLTQPESAHPSLLSDGQCQHLWRKIIKSTPSITYSEGLLYSVINAWKYCQQWQIHPNNPTFYYRAPTRQFQYWWQSLNQLLEERHLITEYQLLAYLIHTHNPWWAQGIVWACFDNFSPEQLRLQEHLDQQGMRQYHYDLTEKTSKVTLLAAPNDKEEYQQLIAWLHLQLQEGKKHIAVVIPNLQEELTYLQRIMAQHFVPTVYDFSLGQSLSQFPLVAHALCWLNLDKHYLTNHQAHLLLQSPYLDGAKEEFIKRSEYLQEGKLLKKQNINLSALIHELSKDVSKLADLLSKLTAYPQEASIEEWINLFHQRLNTLGFPGDSTLNSENYQCFKSFNDLFDEFRQLSLINEYLSKVDALNALQCLSDTTIFQAQKVNPSIQISSLLEVLGCEFDSLWVQGATDQFLPQKVDLSAFIPLELQRNLAMPHSLPSQELAFARKILERLQKSARSVVFSYAQLQADQPNLPCSLINAFAHFELLPIDVALTEPTDLLILDEDFQIPLGAAEPIYGGTAILSNQAKCPFKAFAEHRLQAKKSRGTSDGLDSRTRGEIIHQVMEKLWNDLASQQKLYALSAKELEKQIDKAIYSTLASFREQEFELFPALEEIEYRRLKRLVQNCLEWEKQRPPFTIAALEQAYSIHLGGLDFQVRIDRIDTVADKKWIIDYKSSLPHSKPWNEERPKESQLLLYALLNEEINTLLFIEFKRGKISCCGISEEDQVMSGIRSLNKEAEWMSLRERWRQQLTNLAIEFRQGHCPPQPTHLSTCQQCNFQNLCRFQG